MSTAEWQLVRGASAEALPAPFAQTLDGDFGAVLRTPVARAILAPFAAVLAAHADPDWHAAQVAVADADAADALCVAVAALHVFVQLNWTGPDADIEAVALLRGAAPQAFPLRSAEGDDDAQLQRRAHASSIEYLTLRGEPAYHLCTAPFFLVLALRTIDAIPNVLETLAWWRLRVHSVHRRVLDEPVALPPALLAAHEALEQRLAGRGAEWHALAARAKLERALALQRVGADREASELMVDAANTSGLVYELTGALGRRTRFQKEDKTQLVLLAESREAGADRTADVGETRGPTTTDMSGWQPGIDPAVQAPHQPATLSLNDDTLLEHTAFTSTGGAGQHAQLQRLDPGHQPPLAVTDQCILLALCLNIHNTQPLHGLTAAEMTAFVERVAAHPLNWSVHTMALLLRARLESTRTRTVERSALQLQALIDQMPSSDSSLRERLRFFHALELPARWTMQAELAERYMSLGVLRSALEIYEKIELWESVVLILGMLGRQTEGIEVVTDLLEGRRVEADVNVQQRRTGAHRGSGTRLAAARAAKLWCLRGDLEPLQAERFYRTAWDVSGGSSARAARSLGGFFFARTDFRGASEWLQRAVRINALNARTWFMLGCTFMRLEQWVEGAAAFRKCTAIEDDDGESWNNLASCYLHLHDGEMARIDRVLETVEEEAEEAADTASEASASTARDSGVDVAPADAPASAPAPASASASSTPFTHRELAHRAFGMALKHNHESWKMWSNYMHVSIDVGMFAEAARALQRVVQIRARELQRSTTERAAGELVDMAVLTRLVDAVVHSPSDGEVVSVNEGRGLYATVRRLFDDTLLQHASTDAPVLQAYAKLLFWRGEYSGMLDARIKAFRFGVGSASNDALTTSKEAWLLAVAELRDLVDLLANIGPREQDGACVLPEWRFQARTLVRGIMARTRDSFEDEPEWDELVTLLDELRI